MSEATETNKQEKALATYAEGGKEVERLMVG